MSGGLFDKPLFDAPRRLPRKRRGAAGKPMNDNAAVNITPRVSTAGTSPITDSSSGMDHAVTETSLSRGNMAAPTPGLPPVRTISEVNGLIGRVLQSQLPPVIRVRGEISNFNVYSKGHAFFKLKDERSELSCMMWRNDLEKLRFSPADGLAVIAEGAIKLYEAQGRLQLYVSSMIPRGAGELELAFRQLCDKLRAQGLFDAARKKAIPLLPRNIVVITSPTGDVFHDVLTTARRRFPNIHIMLFPAQVQGAPAPGELVRAIELVNAHRAAIGGVDLILLVRGGGSLEDLWAFNEESVARAIVNSALPIATGIGHEPDITIADLVADLRGPTPTGVAAMVIPEKVVLQNRVVTLRDSLTRDMATRCRDGRHGLAMKQAQAADAIHRVLRAAARITETADRRIAGIEPRHAVAQGWRRLDNARDRLRQFGNERLRMAHDQLADCTRRLQTCSPHLRRAEFNARLDGLQAQLTAGIRNGRQLKFRRVAELEKQLELAGPMQVLKRGYTITTDVHGAVVKRAQQVKPGEPITTRTADGAFGSVVSKR